MQANTTKGLFPPYAECVNKQTRFRCCARALVLLTWPSPSRGPQIDPLAPDGFRFPHGYEPLLPPAPLFPATSAAAAAAACSSSSSFAYAAPSSSAPFSHGGGPDSSAITPAHFAEVILPPLSCRRARYAPCLVVLVPV